MKSNKKIFIILGAIIGGILIILLVSLGIINAVKNNNLKRIRNSIEDVCVKYAFEDVEVTEVHKYKSSSSQSDKKAEVSVTIEFADFEKQDAQIKMNFVKDLLEIKDCVINNGTPVKIWNLYIITKVNATEKSWYAAQDSDIVSLTCYSTREKLYLDIHTGKVASSMDGLSDEPKSSSSHISDTTKTCPDCGGAGKKLVTWYEHGDWGEKTYTNYTCETCNGTGKVKK